MLINLVQHGVYLRATNTIDNQEATWALKYIWPAINRSPHQWKEIRLYLKALSPNVPIEPRTDHQRFPKLIVLLLTENALFLYSD